MTSYKDGNTVPILPFELHTHTLASGHGTTETIADLAKAAAARGMKALGISDHGPATPGSCKESYFRGLKNAPRYRAGIRIFYGAEANILDENGTLDLSDEVLVGLDFCIAAIHPQTYRSQAYCRKSFWDRHQVIRGTNPGRDTAMERDLQNELSGQAAQMVQEVVQSNTRAYIKAMENPYVKFIAHPDDQNYPVDTKALVEAAVRNQVYLEVNEASLSPKGYRGDVRATMKELLLLCKEYKHPILISSDSHGAKYVGQAPLSLQLVRECAFPGHLIINYMELPDNNRK